jgi:hypothetical protein
MAKGKKEDKEFSKHVALQVGRTVLSLERTRGILAAIQPWGRPELVTGADAVVKAVQVLIAAFDELPDGWAPPRGTAHAGAGPSLGKGDFVRIADKRREEYAKKYAGMITAKDMDHLEVLTIAETGRLVVKTKGGALLPGIPRGHLHREEAKARIVEPAS